MPSTPPCAPGLTRARFEPVRERLVDDLVHERRLAGAGDAGDADELADREVDVDPLEVVLRRVEHAERAAVLVAPLGDRDRAPAGEELPRDRLAVALDLRRRPFGDDLAAGTGRRRGPCRRASRPGASSPRRARRRRRCCRCRATARACRSAARCRAGAGRSTARRGCRARRRAASRSASRAAAAAPRRPTASRPRGRGSGSRPRRRRGRSAARGSP